MGNMVYLSLLLEGSSIKAEVGQMTLTKYDKSESSYRASLPVAEGVLQGEVKMLKLCGLQLFSAIWQLEFAVSVSDRIISRSKVSYTSGSLVVSMLRAQSAVAAELVLSWLLWSLAGPLF